MSWDDLVKVALLGTERQPPADVTLLSGSAQSLLAQLDPADAEGYMLGAAAVLGLYHQAGQQPPHRAAPLPTPADLDDLPCCSDQASRHLQMMLDSTHADLLSEWLRLAAARGLRVPAAQLPALLDLGRRQTELREPISTVLGKRGRWLAARNPAWKLFAVVDPTQLTDEELNPQWETGARNQRGALLQHLRETAPAHARELLETTWKSDSAPERKAFIEILETGLSMEDEPFLEAALNDRSSGVREATADLLAQLPDSQLVQRTIERAKPILTLQPGKLLQSTTIEITLPDDPDKAAERDGINPKRYRYPNKKGGKKAETLYQTLSIVPPATWSTLWQLEPSELLMALKRSDKDWREVVLIAWVTATIRHRDQDWAEALVRLESGRAYEALGVLPYARAEEVVAAAIEQQRSAFNPGSPALMFFIEHFEHEWSVPFARLLLQRFKQHASSSKREAALSHLSRRQFAESVHRIPPELVAEAEHDWPISSKNWPLWQHMVDQFARELTFRREIRDAFDLPSQ